VLRAPAKTDIGKPREDPAAGVGGGDHGIDAGPVISRGFSHSTCSRLQGLDSIAHEVPLGPVTHTTSTSTPTGARQVAPARHRILQKLARGRRGAAPDGTSVAPGTA